MKNLTNILFEEILSEGRLEDAKKKYPNIDDDFIDRLYGIDSSGNGKYLDWLLKVVSNLPPDDHSFNPIKMMDSVNYFHEHQQSFKEKDINQYTLDSFSKAVEEVHIKKQEKKDRKNIDKIYEDEHYLVISPKTHSASCTYGAGTKWCITTRDSDNHWKRETSNAIMYFIFDKEKTSEDSKYKVALQYFRNGKKKWWDALDHPFNGIENTGWGQIKSLQNMVVEIDKHKEEHLSPLDASDIMEALAIILEVEADSFIEETGTYYDMEIYSNEDGAYVIGTQEQWEEAARRYYDDLFYDEDEAIHYIGPDRLQYFTYVTDTDKRIIAGEEAQYWVDEVLDDDELIDYADKEEEMSEINDEIDDIDSKMYDLNQEKDYLHDEALEEAEEKIEEFEQRLKNLNTEKEDMIDEARESSRDEKYDEIYGGLDSDPLSYYVDEMGMYSDHAEAFKNSDFIQLDTEALISEYVDNFEPVNLTGYDTSEDSVGDTYYIVSEIDY